MTGRLHGILHASPVAAGPWLFTALALAFAALYGPASWTEADRTLFRALLVHTHVAAMVLTGLVRLPAGRYIGLQLAAADAEPVAPALATLLVASGTAGALAGGLGALAAGLSPEVALAAAGLGATSACLAIAAAVNDARRDHEGLIMSFLAGSALAVGAAIALGRGLGITGAVHGFMAGEVLAVGVFSARALDGPDATRALDREVVRALVRDADLGLAGLLFAAGAYADKLVFAAALEGGARGAHSGLAFGDASFVAALVALPALASFLVWFEAPFREAHRDFVRAVAGGGTRSEIAPLRQELWVRFRATVVRLIELEAPVALVAVAVAPRIVAALQLEPAMTASFRVGVLAWVLHAALLLHLAALAYLDARRSALLVTGAFAGANLLFSAISAALGTEGNGIGYAAAGVLALALAYVAVERAIARLEHDTLRRQPVEG